MCMNLAEGPNVHQEMLWLFKSYKIKTEFYFYKLSGDERFKHERSGLGEMRGFQWNKSYTKKLYENLQSPNTRSYWEEILGPKWHKMGGELLQELKI